MRVKLKVRICVRAWVGCWPHGLVMAFVCASSGLGAHLLWGGIAAVRHTPHAPCTQLPTLEGGAMLRSNSPHSNYLPQPPVRGR